MGIDGGNNVLGVVNAALVEINCTERAGEIRQIEAVELSPLIQGNVVAPPMAFVALKSASAMHAEDA
jgi:hypothetical protein